MSFEVLLKRLSPTLKRIAFKAAGRFSSSCVDDLYQEALTHLWQSFLKGELEDKTDSYILQGCYFHLKNYLRKTREKVSFVHIDALKDEESRLKEDFCLGASEDSLLNEIDTRLLSEEIRNNGFTEREKKILFLCLDGLTIREIGRRLGISHVMVVKLKHGLRNRLEFLNK